MYVQSSFSLFDIPHHLRCVDLKSVAGILNNLFYLTKNRKLLYVTDIQSLSSNPSPSHKLEHLSCFLPGVLALGAHLIPESVNGEIIFSPKERERHLWAARGLGYTCWVSYADSASGLGPDGLRMDSAGVEKWVNALARWEKDGRKEVIPGLGEDVMAGKNAAEERDYTGEAGYYLRPEASLSLWIDTGDVLTMTCVLGRCRLLRACISCGRRRARLSGANADGKSLSRLRSTPRRSTAMPVWVRLTWFRLV